MISRTELSSILGYMSFQRGWSDKISKWKWVFLQLFFSMFTLIIILGLIALFTGNKTWLTSSWGAYFIVIFATVFNHGAWNRDQKNLYGQDDK